MGTLPSALKCDTSSWCPVLAPGRSARATGLAGRQAPTPRARGHPSWSDPIKIHDKGKKRVGQRVKGRKMMLRQAFVCSSPRTRSREDKRGPGALFSGAGGSRAQWGGSVGRREASGTHRICLGPAPPALAFAPSDTTAASHPDACQRPAPLQTRLLQLGSCGPGAERRAPAAPGVQENPPGSCKDGALELSSS